MESINLNSSKEKQMQPLVYIIILNWNGYNDTVEALNSLKRITYNNYKVLVVDNNSDNNEAEKLKNNLEGYIQVIKAPSNLGFAGGNNVGINEALKQNADYVLLLNNDTVVEPDFLTVLVSKFNAGNNIGITAPLINYYSKPGIVWSDGGKISRLRGSGFPNSSNEECKILKKDRLVEFASGCCMLIKKEALKKIKGFDSSYFLYLEDTDLCFRTMEQGFSILVTYEAKIYHKVNSTTGREHKYLPLYYMTRNRLFFTKKNFPVYLPFVFIYICTSMIFKSLVWSIYGKSENVMAVLKGILHFIAGKSGQQTI